MADYGADPLWTRTREGKGGSMVALETLPLSASTQRRLRGWAEQHDEIFRNEAGPGPPEGVVAQWVALGRGLLDTLRHELEPDYDVAYFEDYR